MCLYVSLSETQSQIYLMAIHCMPVSLTEGDSSTMVFGWGRQKDGIAFGEMWVGHEKLLWQWPNRWMDIDFLEWTLFEIGQGVVHMCGAIPKTSPGGRQNIFARETCNANYMQTVSTNRQMSEQTKWASRRATARAIWHARSDERVARAISKITPPHNDRHTHTEWREGCTSTC